MSISGYSWTEDRAENYELSDYYYAGENETRQALTHTKKANPAQVICLCGCMAQRPEVAENCLLYTSRCV